VAQAGCDWCLGALGHVRQVRAILRGEAELERSDVASSFQEKDSYFSAELLTCPRCGTAWLQGYHEDFTKTPIEAEWGERHYILRPLTPHHVNEIRRAAGKRRLDIDTFGSD
jgi:hypothetical protein